MKTRHFNHALIALFLLATLLMSSQTTRTATVATVAPMLGQMPFLILELGQPG
ncbi:MAG: hypothetical protein H7145_23835 [Akkermansiaceae bacterium]|nr:hypothetical protein [Armatimonadota bacterium]